MANRIKAPDDIAHKHMAMVAAAEHARALKFEESLEAEARLREAVRAAFDAGLTVGQIKPATALSESRLYQIRDGRR